MKNTEHTHSDAATQALPVAVSEKWQGCEGWEPLAWALCAEEHGEDACTDLIWEGGPIPTPWGDRWLKYESEAKRMIALVSKHVAAPPAPASEAPTQAGASLLKPATKAVVTDPPHLSADEAQAQHYLDYLRAGKPSRDAPRLTVEVVAAAMTLRKWADDNADSLNAGWHIAHIGEVAPTQAGGCQASGEDEALLPCPFCGSEQVSASVGETGDGKPWHYIECEECAASAEPDVWNRRAPPAGRTLTDWRVRCQSIERQASAALAIGEPAHVRNTLEIVADDLSRLLSEAYAASSTTAGTQPSEAPTKADLLQQVMDALVLACKICDAVPNREKGHLGVLVNYQPDGTHGYRAINDAAEALRDHLAAANTAVGRTLTEPTSGESGQ